MSSPEESEQRQQQQPTASEAMSAAAGGRNEQEQQPQTESSNENNNDNKHQEEVEMQQSNQTENQENEQQQQQQQQQQQALPPTSPLPQQDVPPQEIASPTSTTSSTATAVPPASAASAAAGGGTEQNASSEGHEGIKTEEKEDYVVVYSSAPTYVDRADAFLADIGASKEETVSPTEVQHGTASARMTALLCICNVVGAGILTLPTAFGYTSPLVGFFALCITACVTFGNLWFIVQTATECNEYNYGKLVERGLGKGSIVALVALTLFPFGACCAYEQIVMEAMPAVMIEFLGVGKDNFIASPFLWLCVGTVVFFALSCQRHLSELFLSSIMGVATIAFAILCIIIRYYDGSYEKGGEFYEAPEQQQQQKEDFSDFYVSLSGIVRSIPLYLFALSVHNNAPHYYQHLKNRSPKKMMRTFAAAHVIIVGAYLICALYGYYIFGRKKILHIQGDVLDGFSDKDSLLNVCRLLMFFHFIAVYPILLLATRKGLNNFMYAGDTDKIPTRVIIMQTAGLVFLSAVVAYVVPGIDVLLGINGSVFGSIIILIVPALLYLKLIKTPDFPPAKIFAVISCILGVFVGALGCYYALT